jgi:hypothetical protein
MWLLLVMSAFGQAEVRQSPGVLRVRALPTTTAPILGRIAAGEPFHVLGRVDGPGCDPERWGLVEGGYTCLNGTTASTGTPVSLPRLVAFDAPTPEEHKAYLRDGTWLRTVGSTEALTPFVYGRAWRRWAGTTYASVAAWERGDAPVAVLDEDQKYTFVQAVEAARGPVLVREDGTVVPVADVYVYPVSRFHGVELPTPIPAGQAQAWVAPNAHANIRETPAPDGVIGAVVPQPTPLRVSAEPVTPDGKWYEVPDFFALGRPGYIARTSLRRVRPLAPPPEVGPDEVWIDVDVDQQVLMLLRGPVPIFATLISTGLTKNDTPPGTYQLTDKSIFGEMASRPDAEEDEAYRVEGVPWILHFRPRYALHGVFWHWNFGTRASHGCVNLSPLDARRIFDAVSPRLPPGWSSVLATGLQPGTRVRIRED